MKIARASIFILLFLFIFSCGQTDGGQWEETTGEKAASLYLSESLPAGTLENQITLDVLGGMFRTDTSSSQNMFLSKSTQTTTELAPDISYEYSGMDGKGELVLSISGSGVEKEIKTGSSTYTTRTFSPLQLRFLFFNYAYLNPCLGEVRLTGEISCEITGEYKAGRFIGKSHCANGEGEKISYKVAGSVYEIGLDADLNIGGNIYSYSSYSYTGTITINNESKKIEDALQTVPSCSN